MANPLPTKILIVDDEESLRNLLTVILESGGYETHSASNADDALSILRSQAGSIQAVLLDLNLDQLRGEDFYDAIVSIDPDIAVFPMSGCLPEEIEERFDGKDIAGAILKPFLPSKLLESIEQGLSRIAR